MRELKILYILTLVLVALASLYVYNNADLTGFVVQNQTIEPFFPDVDERIGKLDTVDVVCGGLLYSNLPKGTTCKNDILVQPRTQEFGQFNCAEENDCKKEGFLCAVPGLCEKSISGLSLSVLFEIPKFLEKDKLIGGKIVFVNNGKKDLLLNPEVSLYGLEVYNSGNVLKNISLNLKPGERKEVLVQVKGTDVSDSTNFDLEKSTININFGSEDDVFWSAYVYDPKTAKKCGNKFWNYEGVCYNDVFYPQGECVIGKTCIDNLIKNIRERDVLALGNKTAVFVTVNLKPEYRYNETYYLSLGRKVSEWYDRESARLLSKDMMNLNFEFRGHLDVSYRDETDLKRQLEQKFPNADFILAVLPELETTELGGFTGGLYYFGGFIALSANNFDDVSIAHELAHGFGCEDVYGFQHLGNSRWNNNLLVASQWISGDLLGINVGRNLNDRVLGGCAAEMGWRDYDKDNIVDVIDKNVEEIVPNWMKEISIENVEVIKNQQTEFEVGNYRYFIYPDDVVVVGETKSGDLPIPANVTLSASGQSEILQCELDKTKFYCFIRTNVKGNLKLRAEFGKMVDEKDVVV